MSKAIELADYLRDKYCSTSNIKYSLAEQELRRLDAENAALRAQQAPVDEREAFIADAPIRQKIITLLDCLDGELYLPIESQQELTNEVRASLKPAVPEGWQGHMHEIEETMKLFAYTATGRSADKGSAALEAIEALKDMLAAAKECK